MGGGVEVVRKEVLQPLPYAGNIAVGTEQLKTVELRHAALSGYLWPGAAIRFTKIGISRGDDAAP